MILANLKAQLTFEKKLFIIIILFKIKMKEKESKPNDKKAMSMKTYFGNISF